jgi:hypothetical protein
MIIDTSKAFHISSRLGYKPITSKDNLIKFRLIFLSKQTKFGAHVDDDALVLQPLA